MRIGAWIAGLTASAALPMATANAVELEVTHWWTSGGEAAAVAVLADAFNASTEHVWVDGAIAGSGNVANPVIISRILGSNPMGATQMNTGRDAEDLVQAGLMTDLTELAEVEGWRDLIRPPHLLDSCTFDGRIYCLPVNIHSQQWLWINRNVFEGNGLAVPTNWQEFADAAPHLRELGIIPLATGPSWQISLIHNVMEMGIGGPDLALAIRRDRDEDAIRSDRNRAVWQAFAEARDMVDPGYTGRDWNVATNMVMQGVAAAQIMGDWAQGEYAVAGLEAGVDYDCLPGLGNAAVLDTAGDAFYFPVIDDPEIRAAQLELARLLASPEVQIDFNLLKGSLPVRGDVDLAAANACMQKGLEILASPEGVFPADDQLLDSDTLGQIEDLAVDFFASDMTVDEAIDRQARIIAQAR